MKKYLALFVCLFSAVVFADDPSVSFDVTNLFNDVSALIVSFVGALALLLTSAASAYLIYLGWTKYRESVEMIEYENTRVEIDDPDYLDWLAHRGEEHDVYLEEYHGPDYVASREGDVLVGNYDDGDLPCEDGSGCCFSADCPYFNGDGCDIGRS